MKICIVAISLAKGGAERSTAVLSEMLHDLGHEVHLILLNGQIDYEFRGAVLNLGVDKKKSIWGRFNRMKTMRRYLKLHNIVYIIDSRARISPVIEILYLNYVYKNLKIIYIVHSYRLQSYLTKYKWITKMMINQVDQIVGVSKQISNAINSNFKTSKAVTVYNPIHLEGDASEQVKKEGDYILFLGRLDEKVKNFSLLLESYRKSKLSHHAIKLCIVGDGPDKFHIQKKIKELNQEDFIEVHDFTSNVQPLLQEALFLVLTSHYEGFPMVLVEALSVGTPVISVDCQSGPSEIIQHEINGLLVENHNPQALADAFNRFLLDKELYNHCKANSVQSISHLHQNNIAKQWSKILNDA